MDPESTHFQRVESGFKKLLNSMEIAKVNSIKRLEKITEKLTENIPLCIEKIRNSDGKFDYTIADIDLPDIIIEPNDEYMEHLLKECYMDIICSGITGYIEDAKSTETVAIDDTSCNDETVNIEKLFCNKAMELEKNNGNIQVDDYHFSPNVKPTKDEVGFVASMKRLWENKTPKVRNLWQDKKDSLINNDDKTLPNKLVKVDISPLYIGGNMSNIMSNTNNYFDVNIQDNKDKEYMDDIEDNIEDDGRGFQSEQSSIVKSICSVSCDRDVTSPGYTNVLTTELSPAQSPPLLVMTPETPVPLVKSIPSTSQRTIQVLDSSAKTECKVNTIEDTNKSIESSNLVNEDSPLPPRPIRRLTNDQISSQEEKVIENMTGNLTENEARQSSQYAGCDIILRDKSIQGEKTPVLSTISEECSRDTKEDIKVEDSDVNNSIGFLRPERISYVKRSGLRSMLHHSAQRINLENNSSTLTNSENLSRNSISCLVKTPPNYKGMSNMKIKRTGDSPCRRYHKRLKLISQKNIEENYELTDSEDDEKKSNGKTTNKCPKKVPIWARSVNWIPQIQKQRHIDPFSIFGDSCMFMDLEDVFQRTWYISTVARDNRIKAWQSDRVSSLNWSDDSLTSDELKRYKLQMGFYIDKSNEVYVTEPCYTPSPNPTTKGAWNHINKQRITNGGTTVIRKALNLSIHRKSNKHLTTQINYVPQNSSFMQQQL
ncbi:uncharacterized protein CMU_031210 [Cryptosporidium muris RN66]|uniref:Inner centromere protein ARK-binding domain-containing protein n=1 Tax=Cryptosporidium muris (strain RN66) TaxID=441375 RepID=B6AID9_CRYMR|nr:uncharacterized protein CMU_031210 [Cryptosporidium muris RN66]EEA07980.1 hypothetical protein, conserved [Cryptosporidium muris RN66]|eukprot:XP_002142329.1 hypothetical protein [Cryptosporidium muris RN66]